MERFARIAADALNKILETPIQATDLESPPDPKMGDFGFPCFKLAKQFRKGPPQVAAQLVADLKAKGAAPAGLTVAAVGPYVNFTVPPAETLKAILGDILAGDGLGRYGSLPAKSRGSWVLEYSSPNVAKPLNIYHLRPTALGAVLDKIGRFRGFKVTSINHLGDWGKQYGMLTVAFRRYGIKIADPITMEELVQLYVRINKDGETDKTIEVEAREAFTKLEKSDPEVTSLWKKCCEISISEFERQYKRLGVHFDHIWGESFYTRFIPEVLETLTNRKLLVESEGAQVVHVTDREGREIPPCILLKSDGATIYATRDVAAAIYRHAEFKFDRMTYIVGGEQRLHFQQVFSVLRQMGMEWEAKCEHVPTGLYRFKDAKMSTRKGNFVTLEGVLEVAKERVEQLMDERAKRTSDEGTEAAAAAQAAPLSAAEREAIVEAVGLGAVVFHDLSTDPARDVEFDVERVVDFEGETGPYLQYAHTRCLSILRKARETGQMPAADSKGSLFAEPRLAVLGAPEELALVKTLGQFPIQLERTLTHAKASALAHYLIDVTKAFGAFYRECRVLGEAPATTHARLMLVEATRRVLAQGLGLLLIPLPERM